jgi:phospholipid/cholesterol/gamma-HCH transport system ATP-binding protein
MNERLIEPKYALRIRDLKKSFGEIMVHKGVSFDLYRNEILALMGTSGGGKSLILRSIVGLERPDSGQVWFEGQDLMSLSERQLYPIRCKIGFVFQEGALFDSLTVEENLRYPLELHTNWAEGRIQEEVNRRLEGVDLKGTNNLYPSQLSGGMQKRIGLIRATMLQPRIALVDEPTAGLDPLHIKQFLETANRIKRTLNLSAIVVTHDIDSVFAMCDRIAILADGVIHAIGTVEEMDRSRDPLVRSILHPDFGGNSRRAS